MTSVVYDAPGAVEIPELGLICQSGVAVDVPSDVAAELVASGRFKKAASKRAATTTQDKE